MWHWRDRGVVVITSENFDGEWIARIIRASASAPPAGRRAARRRAGPACSWCARVEQAPVAFTVDGPRGPREVVKPGVAWLARASGHPVVLRPRRGRSGLDDAQLGSHADPQAVQPDGDRDRPGRACRCRRRDPTRLESTRLAVEAALADAVPGQPAALGRAEERVIIFSSERFSHHLTPPGHPERPERAEVLARVAARWGRRGATVLEPPLADRGRARRASTRAEYVAAIAATAGRAVMLDPDTSTSPESFEVARLAAGAAVAAVDAVRGRCGRRAGDRLRAAARPSRRGRSGDGLLPVQQHRRRRGARPGRGAGARGDRRLRRPPRQRHAGGVLRRSGGAVRVEPPVSVLPGHRRGHRDRARRRGRLHRQPAARGRGRRRRSRRGLPADRAARARRVRAGAGAGVGRLRRARGRPAGGAADDRRRGLPTSPGCCSAWPRAMPAAASCW